MAANGFIPTAPGESQTLYLPDNSRYRGTPIYQDKASGQLFFGPWKVIEFPPAPDDTWIEISNRQGLRLDFLAWSIYRDSGKWWVIAAANDISNPFTQLYGYASFARSPLVFSADGRECFYAVAKQIGASSNTDGPRGITFQTTSSSIEIFVEYKSQEHWTNLSPYPLTEEGKFNPLFWGALPSHFIRIIWTATDVLRPEISGIQAPVPAPSSCYLAGGVDERMLSLRIPSLSNVMATLDAAAQNI